MVVCIGTAQCRRFVRLQLHVWENVSTVRPHSSTRWTEVYEDANTRMASTTTDVTTK